jgi:hypothetical protein
VSARVCAATQPGTQPDRLRPTQMNSDGVGRLTRKYGDQCIPTRTVSDAPALHDALGVTGSSPVRPTNVRPTKKDQFGAAI